MMKTYVEKTLHFSDSVLSYTSWNRIIRQSIFKQRVQADTQTQVPFVFYYLPVSIQR